MTDQQIRDVAYYKQQIDFYHTEDRHECTLIHYRMVWMLTSQAILLAGFFALNKTGPQKDIWHILTFVVLGICSVILAIRVGDSINAAERIIMRWHAKEGKLYDDIEKLTDTTVKQQLESYSIGRWRKKDGEDDYAHIHSFRIHWEISTVFILLWVVLVIGSICC